MVTKGTQCAPRYLLMATVLFLGLSALAGGYGLVADPTGSSVGMHIDWLEGSPFSDYLVPGVVLLFVLGVWPLIVVYALWAGRSWSWSAALLVGVALIGWLGVQVFIVGYHAQPPLQLIYGLLGIVIVVLALLPTVRRSCGVKERAA